MLKISDLKVSVKENQILKGVNLDILDNKIHVLMGPNGSGKSTLAQTIMGHPSYTVDSGAVEFNNEDILNLEPNERSKKGIFLSFQYPSEVPGVSISNYLRLIYNNAKGEKLSPVAFRKILAEKLQLLDMDPKYLDRYLNDGFSGGEKKRMEMLQMLVLSPKLVILDETDSGLDVDALKAASKAVNYLKETTQCSVLIITHYTRILQHIIPDIVHIMQNGVIVKEGDISLAHELEAKGYAPFGE